MKITFLGTGAADWKIEDRAKYDMPLRRFSSALVNDDLLIDPGPHIFDAADTFGIGLSGVKNVLLTHSHPDHYNKATVARVCVEGRAPLYCDAGAALKVDKAGYGRDMFRTAVVPGEKYTVGGYTVVPLRSNHFVENEQTLNYLITENQSGKSMFYGCDGVGMMTASWRQLRAYKLDLAVIECTVGNVAGDFRLFEHNNLAIALMMTDTFRTQGVLNAGAKVIFTHFARTLHDYSTLYDTLSRADVTAAADGMTCEF